METGLLPAVAGEVAKEAEAARPAEFITPGEQIVTVISAERGGYAERIIREIAKSTSEMLGEEDPKKFFGPKKLLKDFSPWLDRGDGVETSTGLVSFSQLGRELTKRHLKLALGGRVIGSLYLRDETFGIWYSLKPVKARVLSIGNLEKRARRAEERDRAVVDKH